MTTTHSAIALDAPMRSVRLQSRAATTDAASQAKVEWLVQLGDRQARRDAETKALQVTVQAIQRTLQAMNATVASRLDEIAALVVDLGLAGAREIVGNALARGQVDPTPTVIHCLRDCVHGTSGADLSIALNPDDLASVLAKLAERVDLQREVAAAEIVADPALARGAVRAETGTGRLRYDPRETFERIAAAVRSSAQGGTT